MRGGTNRVRRTVAMFEQTLCVRSQAGEEVAVGMLFVPQNVAGVF